MQNNKKVKQCKLIMKVNGKKIVKKYKKKDERNDKQTNTMVSVGSNTIQKRTRVSNEKIFKQQILHYENMTKNILDVIPQAIQKEFERQRQNQVILVMSPSNSQIQDKPSIASKNYVEISEEEPKIENIVTIEIDEFSSDEEDFVNDSQTEAVKDNNASHVNNRQKFRPPISEERLRLQAGKRIFDESQPCCSKDLPENKLKKPKFELIKPDSISNIFSNRDAKIPLLNISDEKKLYLSNKKINPYITREDHYRKKKAAFDKMMSSKGLTSLFKCMGAKCGFSTNKDDTFLQHLNYHVENPYFDKDYYFKCAYCYFIGTGPIDITNHYKDYHKHCKYQCNQCFYRSVEAQSVFDHQLMHHKSTVKNNKILDCQMQDVKVETYDSIYGRFKSLFINRLHCDVCEADFVLMKDLSEHLLTYKGGNNQSRADGQLLTIENETIYERIGKYECFECAKGKNFVSNNKIEMRSHMQNHPKRFHYAAMRDEETKSIKMIKIKSRADIKTTPFINDLKNLDMMDEDFTKIEV